MRGYNVVDRAVINASPEAVWGALLAELRGGRRWWVPHNTFEPGETPCHEVGGEVRVTVHTRGVDKGGLKLRFTARTRTVETGRRLVADYVEGDFRGWVSFELEPTGDGGTVFIIRWRATTHGRTRVLSRLVDIGKEHSKAARDALSNLTAQLESDAKVEAGLAVPADPSGPSGPSVEAEPAEVVR